MRRLLGGLAGLGLLAACSDRPGDEPPITGPSYHISEARTGGNPDLFFGTPLASNPASGDVNYDAGASHGAMVPHVRICETDGAASATGCTADVTEAVTGSASGLAMSYSSGSELYSVNWHTRQLDQSKSYRIEIWGVAISSAAERDEVDARWRFGWRDIVNAPSVAACNGTEPFCMVNYGQNLPIRVRIEDFVFCPVARNCAAQFVASNTDANLEAKLDPASGAPNAQLFIPGQSGTDFAIALEPCSEAEQAAVVNAIDIPAFGPCLRTITNFDGLLNEPATISLCDDLDASGFGLSHSQLDQLALHHLQDDLSAVQALPEGWQCVDATSGGIASNQPRGLRSLFAALRDGLHSLIAPRTLIAAPRLHRGGGGEIMDLSSYYMLALPAKFVYEFVGDASQSGIAGGNHVLRVKVIDLFGDPVQNARVHWTAINPPGDGATVLGSVSAGATYTDAGGIAQKTVTLGGSSGFNVFHAFGRGIADARESGCIIPPATPAACNGPRATFDPFIPLNVPEFDATGAEEIVDIAEGTRQLFTVFGCAPGFGTATIDGSFSSSEWGCALSFPFTANVSGGSTPATLYVMNNGSNLYLAVRLMRTSADKVNTLQFNFDNNNSWSTNGTGAAQAGDDVLSLDGKTGFTDAFLTQKCSNSGQSSCWSSDASDGGSNDGSGALSNDGTWTTYEISHPLNTADNAHDFSLAPLAKVGLFLTLQTGNGAAGNTQWPGFRQYLQITIKQ